VESSYICIAFSCLLHTLAVLSTWLSKVPSHLSKPTDVTATCANLAQLRSKTSGNSAKNHSVQTSSLYKDPENYFDMLLKCHPEVREHDTAREWKCYEHWITMCFQIKLGRFWIR